MSYKREKLLAVLSITFLVMLWSRQEASAETVSQVDGKTVYTVYTREEFLTEVYTNITEERSSVLIRITDEALAKEMCYEMALRQKRQDLYDIYIDTWTGNNPTPDFSDAIAAHPMERIQGDKELLSTLGVYNKYGIAEVNLNESALSNFWLEKKPDGWYWEFTYDKSSYSQTDYEAMMNKITSAMKSLNLESKNDTQRLKAASDWIMANATYDNSYYYYIDYDNIINGTSICQGYAEATERILRAIGYKVYFVGSQTIDHAWVIVLLNNKWYMIDNTWGDGRKDSKYFLYGTKTAADTIRMGGIISPSGGYYSYDLTQFVNDNTPLADSYYSGDSTTYCLNSWLADITDDNVRAFVGDTIPIKNDRLTKVTSSNPSVASIEDGKIICHKAGRANITRTDGIYISHYFVLVSDKTALSLKQTEYTLTTGKSAQIIPQVTGASALDVTYSSSDKSVAAVNSKGLITAKKKGTAAITVKLGTVEKKVAVTVKDEPAPKISGLKNSYTVAKGKSLKLNYTIKDAGDRKVTVSGGTTNYEVTEGLTMDVMVIDITKVTNTYATLYGESKGKTTITVKVGKVSKKVTITVK